jgi:hypothetical protein
MKKRERRKKVFIFWKWTLGEPYYKSAIKEKVELQSNLDYDTQQNAISQSLEFTNDNNEYNSGNMREEIDDKMSGREQIQQRGVNPFMQQTSYVNDIVVRDMYLKPANTTFFRTREGSSKGGTKIDTYEPDTL